VTETPTAKKLWVSVPLDTDDMDALARLAAADFRRPSAMAQVLLHKAIADRLAPAPEKRQHRRRDVPDTQPELGGP
jgi:hypothetical protein